LRSIRLIDDTGSLFRPPPSRSRLPKSAWEPRLQYREPGDGRGASSALPGKTPNLEHVEIQATGYDFAAGKRPSGSRTASACAAPLLIAADGRSSPARRAAGIVVRQVPQRQSALTALLTASAAARGISTEFHTRGGPFTLVPLRAGESAPHRSSLVWLMAPEEAVRRNNLADAELARAIERQAGLHAGLDAHRGSRGLFPMLSMTARRLTAPRLALVGEAAHVLPPIGAQGLNLACAMWPASSTGCSLRARSASISAVRSRWPPTNLAAAAMCCRVLPPSTRSIGLCSKTVAGRSLRGAGLLALATIGPLRRALMRAGVTQTSRAPRRMHA